MTATRVLHVDDNETFLETAKMLLETADPSLEVLTATSPEAGLELIRGEQRVDCVISDYEMPGYDGVAFLETVRQEFPTLPFIPCCTFKINSPDGIVGPESDSAVRNLAQVFRSI